MTFLFFTFHILLFGSKSLSLVYTRSGSDGGGGGWIKLSPLEREYLHTLFGILIEGRFVSFPSGEV